MAAEDAHPSDREILMAADGELPARRAARLRAHLAACGACRARMAELDTGIREFMEFHRASLDSRLPSASGPRALLKARLAEVSTARGAGVRLSHALVMAAGVVILAMAATVSMRNSFTWPAVPRANLTPGAALAEDRAAVCSVGPGQPAVPARLRQQVFARYGLPLTRADAYEVDYLITPELGGSPDVRNLWPEPYANIVWNAHVKDALEDRLRDLVCSGALDLYTAQRDLATDWIAAYKRYFHTNKPISR